VRILGAPIGAANIGLGSFGDELIRQGVPVHSIRWSPPPDGAEVSLRRLASVSSWVASANEVVVRRLHEARPLLVGVGRAIDEIPEMDALMFLHAGPAIGWEDMSGPMRGAVIGAVQFEGLADTPEEAIRCIEQGMVHFSPNHEHASVAPMAGIVSASMPVWVVEIDSAGKRATCPVNEGMGRVLRFGAFHREHLEHLAWMRDRMLPILRATLEILDAPPDIRSLIAQALQMGDECHNRHKAGSALFFREIAPALLSVEEPASDIAAVATDLARNEIAFLNPTMAGAKAVMDAGAGVPGSSVVTAMTRNGREFGLRLSGLGGRWFTGPASTIRGLYFPGYGSEDANPDLGDSAITETMGLGGFAVAASQAVLQSVGGTIEESLQITRSMYEITCAESAAFQIPALGFRGTPLGIDAREVVHTGILPVINTGIAHREAGIGQIGAGVVRPPMEPFVRALEALADMAPSAR